VGGVDGSLSSPFTINYSVAMERQITPGLVASLGFVGSHSGDLVAGGGNTGATSYGNDVNAYAGDLIQHISCDAATNLCTGTQTRLNTSFGAINYAYNVAHGNYGSMIAAARGRFARRGFLTASYTYGHSLDNWQNYPQGFNLSRFYANSPYDVRHRLSIGASYDMPGGDVGNGFTRRILGGWNFSGLAVAQTGTPFTVTSSAAFSARLIDPGQPATASNLVFAPGSGDFNADGDNNDFPNVASYDQSHKRSDYHSGKGILAACPNGAVPCGNFTLPSMGAEGNEAPNQFRNPGYADIDFTVKKTTTIRERINLELRLDIFNIANRVNYQGVDSTLQDGNFATSTSTYPARNMQVGGRLNF
jgi:hypothetical protein